MQNSEEVIQTGQCRSRRVRIRFVKVGETEVCVSWSVWDVKQEWACCRCHLVTAVASHSVRPCELQPARLLRPWDSPGKDTGAGCHALLQGVCLTQGSNLSLLHCRQILYRWATKWVNEMKPKKWMKGLLNASQDAWKKITCPWGKEGRTDRSISSVQFSSVAQSCPTLCDPMNRSTPGLPVHHL